MITTKEFPGCGLEPLGLYPIVDHVDWLKKLLPLGVKTIQLRIKDKIGSELENQVCTAVEIANQYGARLFINDYWELAIHYQAYGVHLGQDDLIDANLEKIRQSGLRLGISTYHDIEVVRAQKIKPSYIACGPIFHTSSKQIPFAPQGIDGLNHWQHVLADYPIVAIGGINIERFPSVLKTKVSGIAMISAITQAEDPIAATKQFLKMIDDYAVHP